MERPGPIKYSRLNSLIVTSQSLPHYLNICTMSQQLCSVCRGVPEEFWSRAYDLFESRMEIKAKLQSYHLMEKQKRKGCQLCSLLLESAIVGKLRTPDECLYLWRDYSDPHRAFCLRAESLSESLGTLYFFRVPTKWCK